MGYLSELRVHWRPLVAALIGMGSGLSYTTTTASVMAPHLIEEFGWSRSSFAAISSVVLVMLISVPIIGRLADLIGVRRTALIGVISLPLSFIVLSLMKGDIQTYFGVILFQTIVCGTTTATVYSRIVVQYVENARGLALALVASGPPLSGVLLSPLLNGFVEENGWRAGYLAIAAFTAIAGAFALLLLPPETKGAKPVVRAQLSRTKADYAEIFRNSAFWLIMAGMLLCNLPQVMALSQLGLVLQENGVSTADAAIMFSALAGGMLLGRFVCGVALDRMSASVVAAVGMGLPSVGLFLLASTLDAPLILSLAVFVIGFSYGAEGDLLGFLVVRHFGVRIYSSVLGLVTAAIALSISLGAMLLSVTLALTDSFVLFLMIGGGAAFVGSFLFLLLKKPETEHGRENAATAQV